MRILLVKPAQSVCEECCCGSSTERVLPVQIIHAAALLRRAGFDTVINDRQVAPPAAPEGFAIVVVWLSVFETLLEELPVVEHYKRAGATTVAILNDPTGLERVLMQTAPYIDFLVRLHERERTLVDLARALRDRTATREIGGLMMRDDGGEVLDSGERPPLDDTLDAFTDTSGILRELPLDQYDRYSILAGKGCPHSCAFCQYRNTPVRKRAIHDIIAELRTLRSAGALHVTLQDINFFSRPAWARAMLESLCASHLGQTYSIDARLEVLLDPALVLLLRRAGVVHATIGVETLLPAGHESVNKRVPVDRLNEALVTAARNSILPHVSYIIGLPGDTPESLAAIEQQVRSGPFALFDVAFVVPSMGSPLYDTYRSNGLLRDDSLAGYTRALTSTPMIAPSGLSAAQLIDFRRRMYEYATSTAFKIRYAAAKRFRIRFQTLLSALLRRRTLRFGKRL